MKKNEFVPDVPDVHDAPYLGDEPNDDFSNDQYLPLREEEPDDGVVDVSKEEIADEYKKKQISVDTESKFDEAPESALEIHYNEKISLEFIVLGYPACGESIIFILKSDDTVEYVGVVDSYRTCKKHNLEHIISTVARNGLNFLCWTHAHIDHMKGMENILANHLQNDASIVLPRYPDNYKDLCPNQRTRALYTSLYSIIDSKLGAGYDVNRISNPTDILHFNLCSNTSENIYPCSICAIAPHDHLLLRKELRNSKNIANEYSVALRINICNEYFILAGDVEDPTWDHIHNKHFKICNVRYLKIPHHASDSSSDLPDLMARMNNQKCIAVSTSNRRHGLPCRQVLKSYQKFCKEVYTTSSLSKDVKNKSGYGIVKTVFTIDPNCDITDDTKPEGDAEQFQ